MDSKYDVVICGTGLKECILGGLLSVSGKKVLQIDRNSYYGGDCASLNLSNLFTKFAKGEKPPESYGANRDWNVDLVPKFVMAQGNLVKILLKTKVTKYLEWQVVDGTYVYQHQKAGFFFNEKFIHKVPATEVEALKSPLMALLEKQRCRQFFKFCAQYQKDKPETHQGFDRHKTTMEEVYGYFNLQLNTIDFLGHAVALYTNDDYLKKPMGQTMDRMYLYMHSLAQYGKSPFIYPLYGLGTLPEGFSRLSAVHGGVFMLNQDVADFSFDTNGKVSGVRFSSGDAVECSMVICDPSYLSDKSKIKVTGKVIRCICIMSNMPGELEDVTSAQVIIPQKQVNRRHDIYIAFLSHKHGVTPLGKYLAIISTTVETNQPEKEIAPAFQIIGKSDYCFTYVSDIIQPAKDPTIDNVYITSSYDATSHFESAAADVLNIWNAMTQTPFDLNADFGHLDEE